MASSIHLHAVATQPSGVATGGATLIEPLRAAREEKTRQEELARIQESKANARLVKAQERQERARKQKEIFDVIE